MDRSSSKDDSRELKELNRSYENANKKGVLAKKFLESPINAPDKDEKDQSSSSDSSEIVDNYTYTSVSSIIDLSKSSSHSKSPKKPMDELKIKRPVKNRFLTTKNVVPGEKGSLAKYAKFNSKIISSLIKKKKGRKKDATGMRTGSSSVGKRKVKFDKKKDSSKVKDVTKDKPFLRAKARAYSTKVVNAFMNERPPTPKHNSSTPKNIPKIPVSSSTPKNTVPSATPKVPSLIPKNTIPSPVNKRKLTRSKTLNKTTGNKPVKASTEKNLNNIKITSPKAENQEELKNPLNASADATESKNLESNAASKETAKVKKPLKISLEDDKKPSKEEVKKPSKEEVKKPSLEDDKKPSKEDDKKPSSNKDKEKVRTIARTPFSCKTLTFTIEEENTKKPSSPASNKPKRTKTSKAVKQGNNTARNYRKMKTVNIKDSNPALGKNNKNMRKSQDNNKNILNH